MDDISKLLSHNLRSLRKQRGLSQELVSERAGMSLGGVQAIEGGNRWPERETVARLAIALGVSEARLFQNILARPKLTVPEAIEALAAHHGFEAKWKKPRKPEMAK